MSMRTRFNSILYVYIPVDLHNYGGFALRRKSKSTTSRCALSVITRTIPTDICQPGDHASKPHTFTSRETMRVSTNPQIFRRGQRSHPQTCTTTAASFVGTMPTQNSEHTISPTCSIPTTSRVHAPAMQPASFETQVATPSEDLANALTYTARNLPTWRSSAAKVEPPHQRQTRRMVVVVEMIECF